MDETRPESQKLPGKAGRLIWRWAYLTVVLDLFARKPVGWAMSFSPDSRLAINALEMAWEAQGKPAGVIFHSDSNNIGVSFYHHSVPFNPVDVITDAVKTFPHPDSHSDRPLVFCPGPVGCLKRLHARHLLTGARDSERA